MTLTGVRTVLFDLDGTLIDSRRGILTCMEYALTRLGAPVPTAAELESTIGPPLRVTFGRILPEPTPERVERAVATYRERYAREGLFECEVYPGVGEALAALRRKSLRLFVATSKATVYAVRILEHFGLAGGLDGVYGAELGGRFDNKIELLAHVVSERGVDGRQAIMLGDRREDIVAALRNGVPGAGITYGFGSREELLAAGASVLFGSAAEWGAALGPAATPGA